MRISPCTLVTSLLALPLGLACSSPAPPRGTTLLADPTESSAAPPREAADPAPPPGRRTTTTRLSAEARAILQVHNAARKAVGVPPLRWSPQIARYAQAWASRLAGQRSLQHRPRSGPFKQRYGENLAMAGGSNPIASYGAAGSRQWLTEKRRYRHGSRSLAGVGHYTQMVWRKSQRIGCGIARYRQGIWHNVILVCNYDPPGNMMGERPY